MILDLHSHSVKSDDGHFTQGDQRYDLIFAVNGNQPLSAYQRALNSQGSYVCAGGAISQIFQAMLFGSLMSKQNGKKLGFMGITKYNQKDLAYIKELLETGKVAPVIEKSYPLNEVPSAMRYVAEGHAREKLSFKCPAWIRIQRRLTSLRKRSTLQG